MLITSNGSTPYTNNLSGGKRQDVPFPGSWYVTEFEPYNHAYLTDIEENNGVITFQFTNTATGIKTPESETVLQEGQWYNLLGQPIDTQSYHGVAIRNGTKKIIW